ncbi:MAG TPA: hypothetical protein VLB50_10585 [Ignavibacteriaceae bacterium]|nr:hypothetical protein [Ignavibacteriaceae bacterium]
MKYSFIALFFLTSLAFAQTNSQPSLTLKNQIIENLKKQPADISYSFDNTKKSPGLAIIYSLLLPGMGELYAEGYSSGKYFTIAEGTLWGVFIGMNRYANWQRDRYKAYAVTNAGITNDGKNADFYATIADYTSVEQFNDAQALNRDFAKMYNVETDYWSWPTTEQRRTYRGMWSSSEQTFNDIRFVVGALILNRVASAINAVRLVSAYNKNVVTDLSWNVSFGLSNTVNLPTSLVFNFQTEL